MTPDFGLLGSLATKELWRAGTRDLRHQHFTTLGAVGAAYPELGEATAGSLGVGTEYGSLLRLTLSFLNAHLKNDPEVFRRGPALPVELIPRAK